jgi:hypothetical protein
VFSNGARGRGSNKHIAEKDAESAPLSFKDDTAAKTNQSARTVAVDVQIANNIPEEIRDAIRDTPLADNKTELLQLSRLDPETQAAVLTGYASAIVLMRFRSHCFVYHAVSMSSLEIIGRAVAVDPTLTCLRRMPARS